MLHETQVLTSRQPLQGSADHVAAATTSPAFSGDTSHLSVPAILRVSAAYVLAATTLPSASSSLSTISGVSAAYSPVATYLLAIAGDS